jgi:polysaccharide deacetylase 2 family uncharacterized protein YibQ
MSRSDFDQPLKTVPPQSKGRVTPLIIIAGSFALLFTGLASWLYLAPPMPTGEPWAEAALPEVKITPQPTPPIIEKPKGSGISIIDGMTGRSREVDFGNGTSITAPSVTVLNHEKAYEINASAFRPKDVKQASLPRIALVVTGVGLNAGVSSKAIDALPPEFTLAIAAPSQDVTGLATQARLKGFELLVQIPMESANAKENIDSPFTLKASLPTVDNLARLTSALNKLPQVVGIINYAGDKFLKSDTAYTPLYKEFAARGLLALDDVAGVSPPGLKADVKLDASRNLDQALAELEAIAKRQSVALGTVTLYPNTATILAKWAAGLEQRGVLLTPVTAIMTRKGL